MKIGDLVKIKKSSKIGILVECKNRRKWFSYGLNNKVWLVLTKDGASNFEWVYEKSIELMDKSEKRDI